MREKMSMKEEGTSVSANSLTWFGAGVLITEILTGTCLAPLGLGKGLAAIVLGHVTGCMLLFMAGFIGGHIKRSSTETVKMSFGQKGNLLFCGLNVLRLVGWISIMIYNGGLTANDIYDVGLWTWCPVTGGLTLVQLLIGIRDLGKISTTATAALFVLTLVLCRVIFTGNAEPSMEAGGFLNSGAAAGLLVAMSLFWPSPISDYTRDAGRPLGVTAASVAVYGPVNCFIYVIGTGAAIYTGEYDIFVIMVKAGLGTAGFLIVVLSTATTTFLGVYSAGASSVSIIHRIKEKWAAVAMTIIDTATAMVYPMDNIIGLLYLIGSVFVPTIVIQIADHLIIRQDHEAEATNLTNLAIWLAGFVIYRILMRVGMPAGSALPDMTAAMVLRTVCGRVTAAVRTFPGRENVTKIWYFYKALYGKVLQVLQYALAARVT